MTTSDDLRIEEAQALFDRLSREADRRRRRRRTGKVLGGIASGIVVAAALVWAGLALSTVSPAGPSPGDGPTAEPTYRFTDVEMTSVEGALAGHPQVDVRTIVVTARARWSGDEYPGWRSCSVELLDGSGDVVHDGVTAAFATRTAEGTAVRFAVGSFPQPPGFVERALAETTARIGCSGPRLDHPNEWTTWLADPRPNYALDVETVRASTDPGTGQPSAEITGTMRWNGDEFPGVHDGCIEAVFDEQGDVVGLSTFGLEDQRPPGTRYEDSVSPLIGDPITATFACPPERSDTPVAYEISDVRVVGTFSWQDTGDVDGVEVELHVAWPAELHAPAYPTTNACIVEVFGPGGRRVARSNHGIGTGPGPLTVKVWRDAFMDPGALEDPGSLTATVSCHPYGTADVYAAERGGDG
jgi:hypothetical protein